MQFDVVIPTRGDVDNLKNILVCIALQSLQPQRIIFVVNGYEGSILQLQGGVSKDLSADLYKRVEWHIIASTDKNTGNASYARNFGRMHTHSPYVYFIDDDNMFAPDFFARTVAEYLSLKQEYKGDIVYSPTIMRRQSTRIQSHGIKAFHFLVGRPEPVIFSGRKNKVVTGLRALFPLPSFYKNGTEYIRVATIGGNSLFSSKHIFSTYTFDDQMSFIYEDIDCLYRITRASIPLIVSKKTIIHHMERDKNRLQQSFLATPQAAYQKAKNRILFVKKNGTFVQKWLFYIIGSPITSLMTIGFILVRGGTNRIRILQGYVSGIFQGLKS